MKNTHSGVRFAEMVHAVSSIRRRDTRHYQLSQFQSKTRQPSPT